MRLVDKVYKSINEYPRLFWTGNFEESRILVLHHLFLVLGNGYAWTEDGYLIDSEYEDDHVTYEFEMNGYGWMAINAPKYGILTYNDRNLPNTQELIDQEYNKLIDRIEFPDLWPEGELLKFATKCALGGREEPYPSFESSLKHIPDNIQTDWLEGLCDVLDWLTDFYQGDFIDFYAKDYIKQNDPIGLLKYRRNKISSVTNYREKFNTMLQERL